MGRRGKYANVKPRRNIEERDVILAGLSILAFVGYNFGMRRLLTGVQWRVFGNAKTLLFMTPTFLTGLMDMVAGPVFIVATTYAVHYSLKQLKLSRNYGQPVHRYSRDLKWLRVTMAVSFALLMLSFLSYCRVDSNGLYVREMGNLFQEERYTWNRVKSVEITYHQAYRSSDYDIGYWITFDRYQVNVQEASPTTDGELLARSNREIHRIVRANGLRILKDIDKDDEDIRGYLKAIGER